jgi:hypothetical protein
METFVLIQLLLLLLLHQLVLRLPTTTTTTIGTTTIGTTTVGTTTSSSFKWAFIKRYAVCYVKQTKFSTMTAKIVGLLSWSTLPNVLLPCERGLSG